MKSYRHSEKYFRGVIGREWPKRPISSLLPCEMNFLKVYS